MGLEYGTQPNWDMIAKPTNYGISSDIPNSDVMNGVYTLFSSVPYNLFTIQPSTIPHYPPSSFSSYLTLPYPTLPHFTSLYLTLQSQLPSKRGPPLRLPNSKDLFRVFSAPSAQRDFNPDGPPPLGAAIKSK